MNHAPDWIKGTFVWRILVPDGKEAVARTAESIAGVQNLLDRTVRSCVITSGLIGHDESRTNWDGTWPFINRPTFRVGHRWEPISRFMLEMRDKHKAWISFHINVTDVNVGLQTYPQTREFFARMVAAEALFTRDGEGCGVPLKGPAYVPKRIPSDVAKMPYVTAGDPIDIFAIVNYKKFWDSGMAGQMLDEFFAHLPYAPLILYLDVLTSTGSNLTAGLPDGLLGGSETTQREGRESILKHVRSKGTEPGGEGPSWWTNYNWNHGGMSANDYSRIQTGWAQGCMSWRGAEWQHVHGNIGAYSLDLVGKMLASNVQFSAVEGGGTVMSGATAADANAPFSETAEWRTLDQIVEGFYLTTIQELYHIGLGNTRLPGGSGIERMDEHRGRLVVDRLDFHDGRRNWIQGMQASDAEVIKPCCVESAVGSTNGKVVAQFDGSLSGQCRLKVEIPAGAAGEGYVVIRYASLLGGTAEVEVNGESMGEIEFPLTERPGFYSDKAVAVRWRAGVNVVAIRKGSIHAEWSDGTQARWDRGGFRAWNGDVVFGVGYDRMWPDTWSGSPKIYFYSKHGCDRSWKLPVGWRDCKAVVVYPLTTSGRDEGIRLEVQEGCVAPKLTPRQPFVLERP